MTYGSGDLDFFEITDFWLQAGYPHPGCVDIPIVAKNLQFKKKSRSPEPYVTGKWPNNGKTPTTYDHGMYVTWLKFGG